MDLKILSTGSNREIVDNITNYLKNNIEYDITECEQDKAAIKKALSEIRPNVMILCCGEENEENVGFYNVINEFEDAAKLVIIVIATEEDFEIFMEHTKLSNIQFVRRPVSRSSIFYKLEEIKEMFNTGEFAFDTSEGGESGTDQNKAAAETGKDSDAGNSKNVTQEPANGVTTRRTAIDNDPGVPSGTRKHILIVDDDAEQLAQIKGHLQEYYQVTAVRSGPAAFKYLENHNADLILLDYLMPSMDGPEVLSKLRSMPAYKNIPIVFLTGVSEKETIIKTLVQLKPQGYIVKPAKKSEIIAKIIDVLG